jgi:hypothetical protein
MPDFLDQQRTLENYWRAVILFGQNVASYKFALAKSLIDLAGAGQTAISLEDLGRTVLTSHSGAFGPCAQAGHFGIQPLPRSLPEVQRRIYHPRRTS